MTKRESSQELDLRDSGAHHGERAQVISPYVCRLRLARELAGFRKRAGLTHEALARKSGESKPKISRLENGHLRPAVDDVLAIAEALNISPDETAMLRTLTEGAAQRGWWEKQARDMGRRQAAIADLEQGAATIREYTTFVPGLLQTSDFMQAIAQHDDLVLAGDGHFEPSAMVRARATRQRMLRLPGGPSYETIIDELVLRRPTAPPGILAEQLRHLAKVAQDDVIVRVLQIGAILHNYRVPNSAFTLYTYPDPTDPVIASVDTVTSDIVLADVGEVAQYERLWNRLREAALSPEDSVDLLTEAAADLERTIRS
jgi:transcriptional regulator with XRE-family HTH domain